MTGIQLSGGRRSWITFFGLCLALFGWSRAAAAQDIVDDEVVDVTNDFCDPTIGDVCTVESVAAILASTDSQELDTFSATFVSLDLLDNGFEAEADAFLFQDGSEIASGSAFDDGTGAAQLSGQFALTVDSIYDLETDSNVVDSLDGSLFPILSTLVEMSSGIPHINSLSPSFGYVGTSGTIVVQGSDLTDPFTGQALPTFTAPDGSNGVSVSVQSASPTQVVLNYTIAQSATTGVYSVAFANRFGIGTTTGSSANFTVGDPPPVVTGVNPNIWQAGTNISITITGKGFGTSPQVSLSGSGVALGAITSASDTQISTSVSVSPSAPNETVTVTVQSNGYNGSGFAPATPGEPQTGSNTATVKAIQLPTPQILLQHSSGSLGSCNTGTNIAGAAATSVFAGQEILLTGCVNLPNGLSIVSQQWSVNNQVDLSGGFGNGAGGAPDLTGGQELPDPVMTNVNSLKFYWVNPLSTETVSYKYCIDPNATQCSSASAPFQISGPSGFTTPQGVQVCIGFPQFVILTGLPQLWFLGCPAPDGTNVGITLQAKGALPANNPGAYSWVQLYKKQKVMSLFSGFRGDCGGAVNQGELVLDTGYPYGSNVHGVLFQVNAPDDLAADSPRLPLFSSDGEKARSFSVTMYLMWTPNADGSCADGNACTVPVPLGSVAWNFQGDSINTLNPTNANPTGWIFNYAFPTAAGGEQPVFSPGGPYPHWTRTLGQFQCQ